VCRWLFCSPLNTGDRLVFGISANRLPRNGDVQVEDSVPSARRDPEGVDDPVCKLVIPEARPLGRRKCLHFAGHYDLDAHPERGSALVRIGAAQGAAR
jgi:hypothetical protein